MITYELAKKLKDAGFPQRSNENCDDPWVCCLHTNDEDAPTWPTLSELIEACGVAFSELLKLTHTREPQQWVATSFPCEECKIKEMKKAYGSTPEEAVAMLYLALHEQQSH